jgi:hypothetical protein
MKRKFTIYLDFDGTVVEHAYPQIGSMNPGSIDVVKKLQNSGHEIILNTYRADLKDGTLEEAITFLESSERTQLTFSSITELKIHPPIWTWDAFESSGIIFIDDTCEGTPLIRNIALEYGFMVDWKTLDDWFLSKGLY